MVPLKIFMIFQKTLVVQVEVQVLGHQPISIYAFGQRVALYARSRYQYAPGTGFYGTVETYCSHL